MKEFGDVDRQTFGQLEKLVLGQRHGPVFHLGNRGDSQSRARADVADSQAVLLAPALEATAKTIVGSRTHAQAHLSYRGRPARQAPLRLIERR